MRFRSTRGGSDSPWVPVSEALTNGLAPDGGLYVPEGLPLLHPAVFRGCEGVAQVAERLLAPFFAGDRLSEALPEICAEALDLPVPLRQIDEQTWLMELFHGPSSAFKDFGARFLASAMSRLQEGEDRPLTILVATSGDTGGAVAAAFHGKPGVEVVVLYPQGRVSERQAHQLSCWGGNVKTLAVEGDFDVCQALVKDAFQDEQCRSLKRLSSANSINIGRLLPQMAYHAVAALEHPKCAFVIPTGNLGNGLAALWARRVGLPIGTVVLATNANDTLPRLQKTGVLDARPTQPTIANAMDVSRPSNLERLQQMDGSLWDGVTATSVSDDEAREMLKLAPERFDVVVCPHTAIGLHARRVVAGPAIVAATAHPAKFDTVVEPLIGKEVELPDSLSELLARPRIETTIPATLSALRDALA